MRVVAADLFRSVVQVVQVALEVAAMGVVPLTTTVLRVQLTEAVAVALGVTAALP
jgi:hypothetical protein